MGKEVANMATPKLSGKMVRCIFERLSSMNTGLVFRHGAVTVR